MPTTVTSTVTHRAVVPWEDIMQAVQLGAEEFLATHPDLMLKLQGPGLSGSGLTYQWSVSPQRLDQMLRAGIENLPTLGLYQVSVLPNDQINALSVTWQEESGGKPAIAR